MKIVSRSIVFLPVIFLSVVCYSQSSYQEGFVITNDGDSLKGWIDYRQWSKNPTAIKFKRDLASDNPTTYTVDDLALFEIVDRDKYLKATVTKDMRPVAISELRDATDTTVSYTVSDTVFLRVLLEGKISLYELTDNKKVHFYIREEGKDYLELMYIVYLESSFFSKLAVYREQLNKLIPVSKRPDPESSFLARIKYEEKDLIWAVEKINILMGTGTSYKAIKPKEPVSFYIGAGAVYSKLGFSGSKPFISDLDYSKSIEPVIIAGFDVAISRNLQRLFSRLELSWFKLNYSGITPPASRDTFSFDAKISNLSASVAVLYNLINHPTKKVYAGAAFALNKTISSENSLTKRYRSSSTPSFESPYVNFKKSWLSVYARVGCLINKKVELASSFKLNGSFYHAMTPSLLFLNVNYHF